MAAAHDMLRDVQETLEIAEDGLASCPAEPTDPRHHDKVRVLRTKELLSDVLGADAETEAAPPADPAPEATRQRAARASSPQAAAQRTAPSVNTAEVPANPSPSRAPRTR